MKKISFLVILVAGLSACGGATDKIVEKFKNWVVNDYCTSNMSGI